MKKLLFKTDSYKQNHWKIYPPDTEYNYAYFESRKGATFPITTLFGLQPILKNYLVGKVVTMEDVEEARIMCRSHFGDDTFFNYAGWRYIVEYRHGRLPLLIKAAPEGLPVGVNNVLMTVENTDPRCAFLTNFVESLLSHVWYPSTVATLSRACKVMFKKYLDITSENPGGLEFMLHDFGYRGVSSDESAELGGLAHIVNFKGTDTLPALWAAREYYGANADFSNLAYSVAATEHSVMTALGEAGEATMVNQILDTYPNGILSVVADSYDIYNFVDNIVGVQFKEKILARNGVFVVRPDSVTPEHPYPESEIIWILESLWKNFGGLTNNKGCKVLNPKIRVLWGDGLVMEDIEQILKTCADDKWSVENLVFGMGGGLLQKVNRDVQRFAFKSSAQLRNGVWHDVYKKPKDESKASKRGRFKLVWEEGAHGKTLSTVPINDEREDVLNVVFFNGEILKTYTFDEVRANANTQTLAEVYKKA